MQHFSNTQNLLKAEKNGGLLKHAIFCRFVNVNDVILSRYS